MFIYNTTFVVNNNNYNDWDFWLTNTYKPLLKNLVPASEVHVFEVLTAENEENKTISVQWKVATPTDLESINNQSPTLLSQMSTDFGKEVLFFSSILKEV